MEQTLYRHKNITEPDRLSGYFFHINTQLLCFHKNFLYASVHLQCCQNHLKSTHQLEVEQMYTTYWIVVTWRRDWGVTWHVGWGLLILVTTGLSLWALRLLKVKVKYFLFVTWPLDRSITWLCRWGPFTISHYSAKFGIHRAWESGDIMPLICHVTKWLMCHVTCGWGSLILSQNPARFAVHRPCESGNITPLICHMTTWPMCHVILWVRSSHPKPPHC